MVAIWRIMLGIWLVVFGVERAMAAEEAKYRVLLAAEDFELRLYEPHILAETRVEADFEEAGSEAFKRLFNYISGDNRAQQDVAMTAPVGQRPQNQKIDMTTPVGQQSSGDGWVVSFMMPASFTLETVPEPENPLVIIRQVPERHMAAVRYSGFWSEKAYREHKAELDDWISEQGYQVTGDPVWARYNPPFTPWFLRRNEILIPVAPPSTPVLSQY